MAHQRSIAVIGLGYVGLPVAVAFAKSGARVLGFDIDRARIAELRGHHDRTRETSESDLRESGLKLTADPADLREADFFIVTVPTPIDDANRPDLSLVTAASRTVGRALRKGAIVVYESTVYPGLTEEECAPILAAESGLACGVDFTLGYSPERINPGDHQRRFETITKVVSGQDAATLDIVAEVYGSVVTAGVHRAPSIRVAEAAKVIENAQRDLNIALMNELALIFSRLGIDTADVLEAAGTKWNFLRFTPGLVGGHCIGVDPYYLTHKAERIGYYPQVILAGRRINDQMGEWIARECVKRLMKGGRGSDLTVTVLGMTFKENVPDLRNSKVADIVRELQGFGIAVQVFDPMASDQECRHEYGIGLTAQEALTPADAVILAVPHRPFLEGGWPLVETLLKPDATLVMDVKAVLSRESKPKAIALWRP
ncbi:Protein CapL [Hyphomicrobiales bacterium]|nr:Protein CapL [Hyphomicrobiales bacterium]CAH1697724.1 Protein CapL [Hyphomicrobiales bacterium]CAI0347371.1 Protein CapL [Hyphomicrobiales bacterium]